MRAWCAALAAFAALCVASPAAGRWLNADRQDGCALNPSNPAVAIAYAREHGANAIRVVANGQDWIWDSGQMQGSWANVRSCFQAAQAAGLRTYLALGYSRLLGADASPTTVGNYVREVMAWVGPWTNWLAVGNEPDLAGTPASLYRRVWATAAQYLARHWPHIRRVFGEAATVWWLEQAWSTGPRPRLAQALSLHCYDYAGSLWAAARAAQWVKRWAHRPLYCSEMAPDTLGAIGIGETLASYTSWLTWLTAHEPNLTMLSWYYWPEINPSL